jgi:hypothetical protein
MRRAWRVVIVEAESLWHAAFKNLLSRAVASSATMGRTAANQDCRLQQIAGEPVSEQ